MPRGETSNVADGLENVVAAETVLSQVDGEAGALILRGHYLQDIAGRRSFEWLTGVLWQDFVALARWMRLRCVGTWGWHASAPSRGSRPAAGCRPPAAAGSGAPLLAGVPDDVGGRTVAAHCDCGGRPGRGAAHPRAASIQSRLIPRAATRRTFCAC